MPTTPNKPHTSPRHRFNFLKALFHQAPLGKEEFEELVRLAEKFNTKMADYLKANRSMLLLDAA